MAACEDELADDTLLLASELPVLLEVMALLELELFALPELTLLLEVKDEDESEAALLLEDVPDGVVPPPPLPPHP